MLNAVTKMRKVFFRADSNPQIASGHVMRCLPIANQFIKAGLEVCFVTADDFSDGMLVGYEHLNLQSEWDNLSLEIPKMKELLIKCEEKPILFIDTYSITAEYTEALSQYAAVVYLGSKRGNLGTIDFQINYSAKTEPEYYEAIYGGKTKLLLGLKYTPLREEFQNIQEHTKNRVQRVLITTGNTDAFGCVPMILNNIIKEEFSTEIIYDIVVGRMFTHQEELGSLAVQYPNIVLHRNVTRMSDLMKDSDLAITAAGNTILELAAAKVPQIAFSMVEEQVRSAKEFEELGMIDYCGEIYLNQSDCISCMSNKVLQYIYSFEERKMLVERASACVDGKGCERIVNILLNK